MVTRLQKIDPLIQDTVHQAVFLSDTPGPGIV
jgi:hypothetical protein